MYAVLSKKGTMCDVSANADFQTTRIRLLMLRLVYHPSQVTFIALFKYARTLGSYTPLATQLYYLYHFGGDEIPHENLQAVVSCVVKP